MPKIKETLQETTQSIRRPVAHSVAQLILSYTGLDSSEIEIVDTNYASATAIPGSKLHGTGRSADKKFGGHSKLTLEYNEKYLEDNITSTAVAWRDNPCLFNDRDLVVDIRPIYARAEMTLNIQYRARSATLAQQWIDDIRHRVSAERAELPLTVNYRYDIPYHFMLRLAHIYECREKVAGFGDTFTEWLRKIADKSITTSSDSAGNNTVFSVSEIQTNVIGWFDFAVAPEAERNDENGTHTINFSFTFSYDKPIAVIMSHPIIVHNQLLDSRFLPNPAPYVIDESGAAMTITARALATVRNQSGVGPRPWVHPLGGIVYPSYDDWNPTTKPRWLQNIFTTIVTVDQNDPLLVCNLNDLPGFKLKPEFIEFIRKYPKYVFDQTYSPLVIVFFSGETRWSPEDLWIDEDLNIRAKSTISLRIIHHLMIGLSLDLSLLTTEGRRILREDGPIALTFLKAIDPTLESRGLLPKLLGGKVISKLDFHDTLMEIRTTDPVYLTRHNYPWHLVGYFLTEVSSGDS